MGSPEAPGGGRKEQPITRSPWHLGAEDRCWGGGNHAVLRHHPAMKSSHMKWSSLKSQQIKLRHREGERERESVCVCVCVCVCAWVQCLRTPADWETRPLFYGFSQHDLLISSWAMLIHHSKSFTEDLFIFMVQKKCKYSFQRIQSIFSPWGLPMIGSDHEFTQVGITTATDELSVGRYRQQRLTPRAVASMELSSETIFNGILWVGF